MMAVLLAKIRSRAPESATAPPSSGPATCRPSSETNWFGLSRLDSSVVDHKVSSGLVTTMVMTTMVIALPHDRRQLGDALQAGEGQEGGGVAAEDHDRGQ